MKSIILIGMPACGKTTIGKIVSKKLGYNFYDTDLIIKKKFNMSISEIFNKYGEKRFREIETEVLSSLSTVNNAIISTGGGSILNKDNFSGFDSRHFSIVYIKRDLNKLKIGGDRPLSQSLDDIKKLFNERKGRYEELANFTIVNDSLYNSSIKLVKYIKKRNM